MNPNPAIQCHSFLRPTHHAHARIQRQAVHLRAPSLGAVQAAYSRCLEVDSPLPVCSTNVLETERPHSLLPESNLIIHGDNLHALKALLPTYAGRVKCIYIDPPYNTGNEGWIYNDRVNSPLMRQWLADNKPVDGEDLERHDKWLCMMWPRLHLLRELLSEDGVIFVSIDDNEHHHLRSIMDEVFGESNFISGLAVISNLAGSSDQFGFAGAHEYCLAYARNRSEVGLGRFAVDEESLSKWHQDEKGYYKPELLQRGSLTYSESLDYPIFVGAQGNIEVTDDDTEPVTNGPFKAVYPAVRNAASNAIWRWSKQKIRENPTDVFAQCRRDGSIAIYSKQRPRLGDLPTEKPKTVFYKPEYGSRAAGRTLSGILAGTDRRFPYPKAVVFIGDLLRIGAPNPDDIVLDSFAGSGTTAHAVLALNKEDGGNRKFILVECEDYADTITAERVRRVMKGVPTARDATLREDLGGSFTYCTLGEPISIESMLNGEGLPSYTSLATYLLHCATGISADPGALSTAEDSSDDEGPGFFYESEYARYHLLYQPDIAWLRGENGALNSTRAEAIAASAKEVGKSAVVFAPLRFVSQRDLAAMGVTFCQLPYELTASRAQPLEK